MSDSPRDTSTAASGGGRREPAAGGSRLKDLGVRTLSAVLMGAVMLALLIWGRLYGWALVVSAIAGLCVAEFYAITRTEHRKPNEVFGLVAVIVMPLAAAIYASGALTGPAAAAASQLGALGLTSALAGLVLLAVVWHLAFPQVNTSDTATTVLGVVYCGFTLSHLVLLKALDSGVELTLALIISVWVNDTAAYLVGSRWGRHRMSPKISPKKSWEGFAAGTLGTIAVWVGTYFLIQSPITLTWHVLTGVAVAIAAAIGDLFESRLKREAEVKDSGTLLPGHGGFLDRFDSMIIVAVVTYYMLVFGGAR
jgi:phosphatidate cytidylyltransferase